MAVTQAFYAFRFYAPLSQDCLSHYYNNATNNTSPCLAWWGAIRNSENSSYFPTSFELTLLEHYYYPSPQQAWFCIYLYVYSQLMAFSFSNWHTKYGDDGPEQPMCCGNSDCSLLRKPFSLAAKLLCCMWICFMPTSNPGEFTATTKKLLMSPMRLFVIPGGYLSLVELSLRWNFPDGRYHAFSFLFDWCNNFHFIGVFFLGYAIMSGDENGFSDILKRCRWWYFVSGFVLLLGYVGITIFGDFIDPILKYVLSCIFRGYGEWMFMIGLYAINRSIWTENYNIIKILREMAMPFYLLHQQILILLAIGTLRIPSMGSFFVTIILSTLITCFVAFIIVKSPGPIRYFFGLPSKSKFIPGEKLSGFGPYLALCAVVICETIAANIIRIL